MKINYLPIDRILETGVMAVARLPDADAAVATTEALADGGVVAIAFSMTMPEVMQAVSAVAQKKYPHISVGVGTALDPESTRLAIQAGADFVVSPTTDEAVIEVAHQYGKPAISGALTANEILHAYNLGCPLVKVFPIGNFGSGYIKSLLAPLHHIPLMPDGGVGLENAGELIGAGAAALGVGGALVNVQAVRQKEFHRITELAGRFVALIKEAR